VRVGVLGVLGGDVALMEILMRRYNQRLFRAVRSIVKDDSQVEDIVQEAYVRAYEHLSQFEGRAKFSTWLTKIAIYEAYARLRRFDHQNVDSISELEEKGLYMNSNERDPERQTFDGEMRLLLERAFDVLPADFKSVFMLREIEGLSTAETAECLEISKLIDLQILATELNMTCLIEVHDMENLIRVRDRVIGFPHKSYSLLGINNRDLRTFKTDLGTTLRFAELVEDRRVLVSESGIHTSADIAKLAEAGVRAVLVGESLMRSDDIGAKVRELFSA